MTTINIHADAKPRFLLNDWYCAALSTEIGPEALFHRRLLDIPVLIYRLQDGRPVALHDRCPHRFAQLSDGKRVDDDVLCPYHALRFDCSGQCTQNPHGNGLIPKAAKVRSFALLEKYGFIWIWPGDQPADPAKLPDWGPLVDGHPNGVGYTYLYVKAHYELIMDNVMDLSHVDHVHGEIISTRGQLTPLIPKVQESSRTISARWEWKQTPPVFVLNQFLPNPMEEAQHWLQVNWTPPASIQLSVGATQGEDYLDLDHTVGQYDLHTVTPESADRTHYFFATRRNHIPEDAEYNKLKLKGMHDAFEQEDVPLLEQIQREMRSSDFLSLNPVLLSNDAAPVKVRRALSKLIQQEAALPQADSLARQTAKA